ncbi:hypothetical protein GOARA_031_00190 [Gordonia araii NBRC 100433]|uniref:Uncharacterized protein n=1 Tax=Gordonia araii NBRC 100433 TaxID=1073574 RepID=G7H019_9ACTN|nr:hypothetical protein GOARA_031_00190 [Gordonia araii NBRC 100433]
MARDGGPVDSDPAAATEEECALHGNEITRSVWPRTKGMRQVRAARAWVTLAPWVTDRFSDRGSTVSIRIAC